MNAATERAIRDWNNEVEEEMQKLICRGVPPFDAVDQARKNVSNRRRVASEAGNER